MRNQIFRILSNATWKLCVFLNRRDMPNAALYVLSGHLEYAADGNPFEWPTDWDIHHDA